MPKQPPTSPGTPFPGTPKNPGSGTTPKNPGGGTTPNNPGESTAPQVPGQNSPIAKSDELLKTADKLMKDVAKTKDYNSLLTHCEEMLSIALELISDSMSSSSDDKANKTKITENIKAAVRLIKKSIEISEKYLMWIPTYQKGNALKVTYVCPKGCETADKPGKCSKCGTNLEKEIDNLLKTADKLMKDADKTNNYNSLLTHCEEMLRKSLEMVSECNKTLSGNQIPTIEIYQLIKDAIKLMNKSTEIAEKYMLLMLKDKNKESAGKIIYACPKGCVTSDKPGKCSMCGTALEKQ